MKTTLFINRDLNPQKEARLIYQRQVPQENSEGNEKGFEQAEQEIPFDYPITITGDANTMMKKRGYTLLGRDRISIGNRNLRFDDTTKKISIYTHKKKLCVEVTNKNGSKDIASIDKDGMIDVENIEKEKEKEVSLTSLIAISKDRGWMKELAIDASKANQLIIANKYGITLEDNNSKSNGFNIMKGDKRIGEVTVNFNDNWQKQFSDILNKELSSRKRENSFTVFGAEIRGGDIVVHIPGVKGADSIYRQKKNSNGYECVNYPENKEITERELQKLIRDNDAIIISK